MSFIPKITLFFLLLMTAILVYGQDQANPYEVVRKKVLEKITDEKQKEKILRLEKKIIEEAEEIEKTLNEKYADHPIFKRAKELDTGEFTREVEINGKMVKVLKPASELRDIFKAKRKEFQGRMKDHYKKLKVVDNKYSAAKEANRKYTDRENNLIEVESDFYDNKDQNLQETSDRDYTDAASAERGVEIVKTSETGEDKEDSSFLIWVFLLVLFSLAFAFIKKRKN